MTAISPQQAAHDDSLLKAVRAATHTTHTRIEASAFMRRLFSAQVTPDDFASHLKWLLGFYEPLEAALTEAGHEYDWMPKSGNLKLDLTRLNVSTDRRDLVRCSIGPIDPGGLPGAIYVHAGAALGGQIIARHITATLRLAQPSAFYCEDGETASREWKAFRRYLTSVDSSRTDAVCKAAVATFAAFEFWIAASDAQSEALR